jgi:hypothetical protein
MYWARIMKTKQRTLILIHNLLPTKKDQSVKGLIVIKQKVMLDRKMN